MTTPHTKDLGIAIRDALDGVLFRFWVRAASFPFGFPAAVAFALTTETIVEMIVRAVEKRRKVRKP